MSEAQPQGVKTGRGGREDRQGKRHGGGGGGHMIIVALDHCKEIGCMRERLEVA